MAKWADGLISAVHYDEEKTHIDKVRAHEDLGNTVGSSEELTRGQVISYIEGGKTFVTIYKKVVEKSGEKVKWTKGEDVRIIVVDRIKYIRTDRNSIKSDNLGELPTF